MGPPLQNSVYPEDMPCQCVSHCHGGAFLSRVGEKSTDTTKEPTPTVPMIGVARGVNRDRYSGGQPLNFQPLSRSDTCLLN